MDYLVGAFEILLDKDCILQRYYPLLPYKGILMESMAKLHCISKNECTALSDAALLESGLPSPELVALFRRFLVMYDVKDSKYADIGTVAADEAETAAFRELYLLPGVNAVRAALYYRSGYGSLRKIAAALPDRIIQDTSDYIRCNGLAQKPPLPKEVRTHIAVAKAFTEFAV